MAGLMEKYKDILTPEQLQQMQEQINGGPLMILLITLGQALVAGFTINALAAFLEEIGWRGLLYRQFRKYGFWVSSLIIGAIWGFWHGPIILMGHNYPEHPVLGVGMMIIWCILLAPMFTLIRDKSGSVIAAAIMHGTLNAFAGVPMMYIIGGNDLTVGVTGLAGFIALIIINIIIYIYKKNNKDLYYQEA